ncbi:MULTISPECIES: hypothetical protein [Microbacterium]|uniref:hypothetical protein n=1 Tax=Microbacterium TaxID=33882 RepID=UPI0010F594AD|nr:hypothetical protein [Microbacterium sp. 4NA327F11]
MTSFRSDSRTFALLIVALASVAALSGCSGVSSEPIASNPTTFASSPTASPVASPSASPVAGKIELSRTELTVSSTSGASLATASFTDCASVEAIATQYLGAQKRTPQPSPFSGTVVTWSGVALALNDHGTCSMQFSAAASNGLVLTTPDGVSVGDTVTHVVAAGGISDYTYGNGTDTFESFAFDAVPVDGTTSLTHPGQVGKAFLGVETKNGRVQYIDSNGNDYSDI